MQARELHSCRLLDFKSIATGSALTNEEDINVKCSIALSTTCKVHLAFICRRWQAQGWKNPIIFGEAIGFLVYYYKIRFLDENTMGLFGSMSGHLLGRFTAGIIVTVMRVVVEGRQVALNERQFVPSFCWGSSSAWVNVAAITISVHWMPICWKWSCHSGHSLLVQRPSC